VWLNNCSQVSHCAYRRRERRVHTRGRGEVYLEMPSHPKYDEVRVVVGFEFIGGDGRVIVVFTEESHLFRDKHPCPGQDMYVESHGHVFR
jgi:hypothetical protein